jgi:hypothetical protein
MVVEWEGGKEEEQKEEKKGKRNMHGKEEEQGKIEGRRADKRDMNYGSKWGTGDNARGRICRVYVLALCTRKKCN